MKNKIVIFDVDNTILKIDSLFYFIIFIIKKSFIKIFYLPFLFFVCLLKFFKIISIEKLKNFWLLLIKNIPINKLDNLSKEFIEKNIIKNIKPEIVDIILNYKSNNYKIIFATASFEFYIKYLADYFNIDYYVGTKIQYNEKKKNYTIYGNNCKGYEKINRILKIIPEQNIDITNSIGYSDSLSDKFFNFLCQKFYLVDKKKWIIKKEFIRDEGS